MKEKKSRKLIMLWAFVLLIWSAFFWNDILWAVEPPPKVLVRCGSGLTEKHFSVVTAKKIAELAAQKSNKQIEFKFFLQGVLGSERDLYEGLQMGTLEAVVGLISVLSNFEPKAGVLDLPYAFDDIQHAYNAIVRGNVGRKISDEVIKKSGIRILAWMVGGPQDEFRTVSTVSKPIEKMEDLRGLKIRVAEVPIYIETFKLLGANPTPIPMGEVYTALQTKVVEGLEIPPYAILSRKYYEVVKFMALTNHAFTANVLAISEKFFNGLTPEHRKVLQEAAKEAVDWQQSQSPTENVLEGLKNRGMRIITVDLKPFREKVIPLQESFAKKMGALDLLQEIRNEKRGVK